jgi:hypothetical protein
VAGRYGGRIRTICQENQGLSAARNVGIRAARGEFVGVLDADDMYEPAFLATLIPILETHPEAGAVTCGYRFVDQRNVPLPQVEARPVPPEELFTALLEGNYLVPEAILVRSRCYREVGPFDINLSACEDWDMWLRIANHFEVRGTDSVLTRHRVLPGSMSTNPERMLANRLAVLERHFGPLGMGELGRPDGLKRRAYGRAYLGSAVEFLQAGDSKGALRCLAQMAAVCHVLLAELSTSYELALGRQPKGARGDFSTAPTDAEPFLLGLLNALFESTELTAETLGYRQIAHARAYEALGRIAYGARRPAEARRLLGRSLALHPGRVDWPILTLWLRSLLPPWLLDAYSRQARHRRFHVSAAPENRDPH